MNNLIKLFIESGMLQFGWFEPGGIPFRLMLDTLPAYPDTLKEVISAAKSYTANMNRLVSTHDALPLGVGLSLETNIPLVYSRGSAEAPSYDLVGAYDINHPTLLLVNTLDNAQNIQKLVTNARSVGLQIHQVLAILKINIPPMPADMRVEYLLDLRETVTFLVDAGRLPKGHGQAVGDWLDCQSEN